MSKPLKSFANVLRVVVIAEGHALHGKAGFVWRRRTSDNAAWVTMDEDLPPELVNFPASDPRHRNALLYPDECAVEPAK